MRFVLAVALALSAAGATATSKASCRAQLGHFERSVVARYRPSSSITITFTDDHYLPVDRVFSFERLRIVDGKIKLRLRDADRVVQLVGVVDRFVSSPAGPWVRVRVQRLSGVELRPGSNRFAEFSL